MNGQSGASLIETLVILGVAGLMMLATTMNVAPMEAPLQTGSRLVEGFIISARSSAVATTTAYRIVPDGNGRMIAEYAADCADTTWTPDPGRVLELPEDVTLDSTTWSVCFSRRGVSTSNLTLTLSHPAGGSRQVEVLLGGATRVLS